MSERQRILVLTLIVTMACASAIGITLFLTYSTHLAQERERLAVTAQSQARLIEAVTRFNAEYSSDYAGGSEKATLSQIVNAHENFVGFGETGDFMLARREGDLIVFQFRHRHGEIETPAPIPLSSDLAEPMRLALSGLSGTVIGLDYRGTVVLAAHEPVGELNMGIVAKIDLAEVRAPFIRAALVSSGLALLIVLISVLLFRLIGNPIIARLEESLKDLGQEMDQKQKAETERKLLIEELEGKNAELERFVHTASHDLKSPLITIRAFAGKLESELAAGNTEHAQRRLSRISDASAKMSELIDSLLEFSRIGRQVNPPVEVAFADLAQDAVELLSGPIARAGAVIDIDVGAETVRGDRVRLCEVLQNLIENSLKFAGDETQSQIEVGIRADGDQKVFYVRDNGIGIDPAYHERVFELFDQIDPKLEGTGTGLALARRIVGLHNGRIWIESEGLGRGATFCFTLPLKAENIAHRE